MAQHELHKEFTEMHSRIALGSRALVAMAAHLEVRSVLRDSTELRGYGLDDVLIGSYARRVSIWPGRDVDVFGRLMAVTVDSLHPDTAYEAFHRALRTFEDGGRLVLGPRSFRIDYSPTRVPSDRFIRSAAREYGWDGARVRDVLGNLGAHAFEFSVDVVPAAPWNNHYGIPETLRDPRTGGRYRTGQWRPTDPVGFVYMTRVRNRRPRIGGIGAYVRTVKELRQIKSHHLRDSKPSSLYYEFALHEGFEAQAVAGETWADLTASALTYLARRLEFVETNPILDPVLGVRYLPVPDPGEMAAARAIFERQARAARRATTTDHVCQAGIEWRQVFGGNAAYDNVFHLPAGCRGTGAPLGAAAANLAAGGTAEKGFGGA